LLFPFQGWIEGWAAYEQAGWKSIDNKLVTANEGGTLWTVDEIKMRNQYGLLAYGWAAFFDGNGVPVLRPEPSEQLGRQTILDRLRASTETKTPNEYYQIQVLFESGRELTVADIDRDRKLFYDIFESIRQQSQAALKKGREATP
jgi:hypothetical protein